MTIDKLRLLRSILLRSAAIGAVFQLFQVAVTVGAWDFWTGLVIRLFHLDAKTLSSEVLRYFIDVKFLLIFVLLIPGLAIHWTIRKE